MRQIYQKATQVIVWLGGEDDTTTLALELCGTFLKAAAHIGTDMLVAKNSS